ncbi:MAG: hypothetical protein IPG01_19430 [Chitinophagaceae bacterium]|nr:hypothetical protein [Chitinophagaceae bacterium]
MKNKLLSFSFCLLCVVAAVVINYYPVGDWVSAPLITFIVSIPSIIIEFILLMFVLTGAKRIKGILIAQVIIAAICVAVMINYIVVH